MRENIENYQFIKKVEDTPAKINHEDKREKDTKFYETWDHWSSIKKE